MDSLTNNPMSILDLPHDMILHIFNFIGQKDLLFSVRYTCVLWNQLTKLKIFWKKLDVNNFSNYVFPAHLYLNLLEEIQDSVEILVFNLKHHNLKSILHEHIVCPNLREINFEYSNTKTSGDEIKTAITAFAAKYPEIKKLSLFSHIPGQADMFCSLNEFSFTGNDRSLMNWKQFLSFHPYLTSITFRNCLLDAEVFLHIVTQYPELETLDISSSQSSFSEICDYIKSGKVNLTLTKLKTLDISKTDISDALLEAMTKYSSCLKCLNITCCPRLTNTGVEAIAEQCQNLTKLIINVDEFGHSDVSSSGVQCIAEKCKHLEVVKLNYCPEVGNDGIKSIVTSCLELKELEIAGCLSLLDSTVNSLAEKCHFLQKLKVSGCSKLTSKSMSTVLKQCKHLKWLNMESCHRVSDLCLQELPLDDQHCVESDGTLFSDVEPRTTLCRSLACINVLETHSHITTLIMKFCSMITNNCMRNISVHCPDLQTLDIQACYLVTNAGVRQVLKRCQFLSYLDISGGSVSQTSRINNDCLNDVVQYGHKLQELKIVDNYNITVDGIIPIIQDCRNIFSVSVGIGRRTNISKEGLLDMSGNVKNKTICLQFKVNAEILIYDDAELSLKKNLVVKL